jgi:hypothetical protein
MSRQRWIDAFFRERLERRGFPVEEGEFESIRTLIDKSNADSAGVRGGLSKWWLSVLVPVGGLLWWALSNDAGLGVKQAAQRVEQSAGSISAGSVPDARLANMPLARADGSASVEAAALKEELPLAAMKEQVEPLSHAVAASRVQALVPLQRVGVEARSISSSRNDPGFRQSGEAQPLGRIEDLVPVARSEQEHLNTGAAGTTDMPLSLAPRGRTDRTLADVPTKEAIHAAPREGQEILAVRASGAFATVSATPASERVGEVDAVAFLSTRWPEAQATVDRQPVRRSLEVINILSSGELHVFGAPLHVRTRTSDGQRSGPENGSLLGFEYRVRIKRFAWSTGVFYGTYASKVDQAATDVQLSFVEIPLLASVRSSKGRFGLLLQGGLSFDLLFNAKGRYPVEEDHTTVGFPDDAFQTVNLSCLLRPQAAYAVNEYLSVSAGPLWKAQLGGMAMKGPLDGARMSSAGFTFGISWRLERSTF